MNSSNVTPHTQKYCPRVFKFVPKQRFSKCSRIYYTQVWLCMGAILKFMNFLKNYRLAGRSSKDFFRNSQLSGFNCKIIIPPIY